MYTKSKIRYENGSQEFRLVETGQQDLGEERIRKMVLENCGKRNLFSEKGDT